MKEYNHLKIEKKWQTEWEKNKTYQAKDRKGEKFYSLVEFPYPSGDGLHVGHPRPYIGMDVVSRKKRMEGKNVLFPIGWDAFGLPTENYAIKTGKQPKLITKKNTDNFRRQIKSLGISFDWSREINTTDPNYYKWTQWLFLQFFKKGLAYKAKSEINWCPKDKIGLANEEVIDGKCERCGTTTIKKEKEQWMLGITKYADRLDKDLDLVDYPERVKLSQRNWIGRSEGSEIDFKIKNSKSDSKRKVLIGTRNPAKVLMIKACFENISGIELVSLDEISSVDDLKLKEGDDFLENAKKKSEFYFKKTGLPTISTDHILWIEKWPKDGGIITHIRELANPKTKKATDQEALEFLLKFLKEVDGESKAHFIYAVSFTDENGTYIKKEIPGEYILQTEQAKSFWPGYPTEALLKDPETGIFKSEQKNEVRYQKIRELFLKDFLPKMLLKESIKVFTTRIDTIFSGTFIVLAPEHLLIKSFLNQIPNKDEVEKYIKDVKNKPDIERMSADNKTGVCLKGIYAINPATNDEMSIWVSDFVLGSYGTGAVFADAHDKRDFDMAKKYGISLKVSIRPKDNILFEKVKNLEECFEEEGILFNSGQFDNLTSAEARPKIIGWLEAKGSAKKRTSFKLRDWIFSRQRYWGEPIPVVNCENCRNKKYNYILLHGYRGQDFFIPWLKAELEKQGHSVYAPHLPNPFKPNVKEQAKFVLKNATLNKNTIIMGVSLGCAVAMKLVEEVKVPIHKLLLVDGFLKPEFVDKVRPEVEQSFNWKFDFKKIKAKTKEIILLVDEDFPVVPAWQSQEMAKVLDANLLYKKPLAPHFQNEGPEPTILDAVAENGLIPVPLKNLPVKLPEVKSYKPTDTGESPLASISQWVNTKCPKCGGKAKRETDTMPNWAGSSWYYLRYTDPKNKKEFASKKNLKYWTPVDWYNGGMEHTTLHLLYSRFWHKFFYDLKLVPTVEPYMKRTSHGMILGEGGVKMSKSLGNVINPDEIVKTYGADTLRVYEMFMGPFEDAAVWNTDSIIGARRFIEKVWRIGEKVSSLASSNFSALRPSQSTGRDPRVQKIERSSALENSEKLRKLLHKTIKKVGEDIEAMRFNTAISAMMILASEMEKAEFIEKEDFKKFLQILAPFAPHIAEDIWRMLGEKKSINISKWPKYDEKMLVNDELKIVIQVNGKVRGEMIVRASENEEKIKEQARINDFAKKFIEGKEVKKIIYVKGRLVNIVV